MATRSSSSLRMAGTAAKEFQPFAEGHVQDIVDILSAVLNGKCLLVVALPAAGLAVDVDIRQEGHLHLDLPLPRTGLAAAARHVEGKSPRAVAPHPGVGKPCEKLPDLVEEPHVGGRRRPGRTSDGRVIDLDDPRKLLPSGNPVIGPRPMAVLRELCPERLVEDFLHEGRLSGAAHAGHAGERLQGNSGIDPLQIVFPRPRDRKPRPFVYRSKPRGDHPPVAVHPGARHRVGILLEIAERSLGNDTPPQGPRARDPDRQSSRSRGSSPRRARRRSPSCRALADPEASRSAWRCPAGEARWWAHRGCSRSP